MSAGPGPEPSLHVSGPGDDGVVLVEVEGSLDDGSATRWEALLRGAAGQAENGLAIDLRGCAEMSAACLLSVIGIAEALDRRSRPGVALVVLPGSALERQLASTADVDRASTYASLAEAFRALHGERSGRFRPDPGEDRPVKSRFRDDREQITGGSSPASEGHE